MNTERVVPEGFHFHGFIFVHDSLRNGLRVLNAAAPAMAARPVKQREDFLRWLELFWRMLQGHHLAEDRLIFPALAGTLGDVPSVVASLKDQHHDLYALHARVLKAATSEAAHDLVPALEAFSRDLRSHFDEEEGPLVSLIAQRVSKQAQEELADRVRRTMPGWRNTLLVPWIVEQLERQPPDSTTLPRIPLPWRLLQGRDWVPR